MRILFAHCFYRVPGGEDRHVRDQFELVSRGHDVELISEDNTDLSESAGTAARMLYSRAKKHEVLATIDRFAPDVMHVHNSYPSLGPAAVLAAGERNIPVVMTVHNFRLRCPNGFMFTEGATCRRCESGVYVNALMHRCFATRKQASAYAAILWIHRFLMRLEERIARFIVPSEFMRQRLLNWGIEGERIGVIPHFVQATRDVRAGAAAGSYGVFLGRLSAEKGLPILLAALHQSSDPPFLIAGDGPQRRLLEDLTLELGLANTRFLGWVSHGEASRLLSSARYVAIPSTGEETANLSALEGLAAARPLLVSDRGALPELVTSGAGLTFRAGDEVDLSRMIVRLMSDDELCRRASIAAATSARGRLSPERHLADLEGVYRGVANE